MPLPAHRYFLDRTFTGGAVKDIPYPRWDRTVPAELRYPYDILEAALPSVDASGLHFYFTKNAYELPEYGRRVVSVLLQEERCKVPVYGRHVRITLRNLLSRPFLGFRPHRRMGRLEALLSFEYARDWYTHTKSVRAQSRPPESWGAPIRSDPRVTSLPLGYHSQEELAQVPMAMRGIDLFFAGQVKHEIPRNDYRHWVSTSKFVARQQLWNELRRLEAGQKWRLDLGNVAASQNLEQAATFQSYSQKMMHTRICVAPRGSVAETYRAFEGLRAGCLVVANRLPPARAFANSPILQIDHWRQLEGILEKYARNIDLLEEARAASLEWWDSCLTVKIQAGHVARDMNEAARTMFHE
jgi:hypothetical protein